MEDTADNHPLAIGTFQRRERRQKPKSVKGVIRRKRGHLKTEHKDDGGGGGGDEEDEEVELEVEKKIMELQRIVPGGEWVGIENLFEQTASYILALQCQVKAMNAVASFLEGLDMEKRKLGG